MTLEHSESILGPTVPAPAASAPTRLYETQARNRPPLRVALVVPLHVPAWLAAFLRSAGRREWIEVSVLLAGFERPASAAPRRPLDLRAYLAIERLRWHRSGGGMLARVDVSEQARRHGSTVNVGGDDIPQLRADLADLAPDLVLLYGDRGWAKAVADCAPWGCWCIGGDLGDPRSAALGLLTPLLDGELATSIELQLDFQEPGRVVALAGGNTATQAGSFALQRDQALRKLPVLLLRGLSDLHAGKVDAPKRRVAELRLQGADRTFAFGTGLRAFEVSLRHTLHWWNRVWHGEDPWFLALRTATTLLDPATPQIGSVATLVAPAGRYWADPCVIEHAGQRLLFVEEYGYRDSKGVIVCLELLEDGSARRLGIALEEAWHLSYPQVFESDGRWYLTVESGAARRASLYRAAGFPLRWKRVGDLLSGCLCVDPTLYQRDGHWYLFANVSESGGGTCDELFLFVADSLIGPYRPHPVNPIVRDVRRSRPAGRLFERDGRLIRPAQDCAPDYGAAIVFNEVLELSPTRYRERELARVAPSWLPGLWGCHTYSSIGGTEVIDGRGHPADGAARIVVTDDPILARDCAVSLPVVSVLMPVYNGERFLAEAVDSALQQTLHNIEVVIVDDGSTDASGAIADRYAIEHADRVRVVHQVNQGLPLARNAAIAVARGRYLALLDADDLWLPGHLAACVDVLERDPMIGLVHADAEDIDADGNRLAVDDEARWGRDSRNPYAAVLLRRQHIVCPTAVFRRSVVDTIGAFDPAFNRLGCEDRDMWLRLAEVSKVVYLEGIQARYRIHGSNMSANSERMWRARKLLVDKYAQRPRGRPLLRRARAAIDADLGHELAREPEAWPALVAFARALRRDPLRIDAWKGLLRRILVGKRPGAVVRR
jgi:glycosyltransferase involved in cell wall biosynthesis